MAVGGCWWLMVSFCSCLFSRGGARDNCIEVVVGIKTSSRRQSYTLAERFSRGIVRILDRWSLYFAEIWSFYVVENWLVSTSNIEK